MKAELAPTNDPGTPSAPRYPGVKVKLSGSNGNAFAILGACQRVASRAGVSDVELRDFSKQAMDGDYDHLLRVCMCWFDVS